MQDTWAGRSVSLRSFGRDLASPAASSGPNQPRVTDIIDVPTWQGWVYVAELNSPHFSRQDRPAPTAQIGKVVQFKSWI